MKKLLERLKNPKYEKIPKSYEQYYEEKKESLLAKKRAYWKENGQRLNQEEKIKRIENIVAKRILGRLKHWRSRQKELTLLFIENEGLEGLKASNSESFAQKVTFLSTEKIVMLIKGD